MAEPQSQASLNKKDREASGDAAIGTRLREARRCAGLTLQSVADYLKVSKSAVSQWESGDVAIASRHIPALATILNVPVTDLVAIHSGEAVVLTERESQILQEVRRLSPERQESLLIVLKGF